MGPVGLGVGSRAGGLGREGSSRAVLLTLTASLQELIMPAPPSSTHPQTVCAVGAAGDTSPGGAPKGGRQEAAGSGGVWGAEVYRRRALRASCWVPGALISRPTQHLAAHQGCTEGVGRGRSPTQGGVGHSVPCHKPGRPFLRLPGPQDVHTGRSHLRGEWTLVSVPGSEGHDPEAA